MTDKQWQRVISAAKIALAFLNAFAAILAGYPGPDLSPLVRLLATATVAGCGATLLMLDPPGKRRASDDISVSALADELERRNRRRQQAVRS